MNQNLKKSASVLRFGLLGAVLGGALLMNATSANAQIALNAGQTYTQNFDSIGATATAALPTDIKVDKVTTGARTVNTFTAAVSATERVGGANLSTTAGNGIYNFGAGTTAAGDTDRAVGFVSSASATQSGNIYARFTNNTGGPIGALDITFDVEKYRNGTNTAGFRVEAFYSANDTTYTTTGLTAAFPADTGTNSGFANVPNSSVAVIGTFTPTTPIAAGATFYLAFNYSVASGTVTSNAQALGVDNLTVAGRAGTPPTNTAPTISALSIAPTDAKTNDTLTATPTATDPDAGQTLTYTYEWRKNGTPIAGVTGNTLNLATAGFGDEGDVITVVGAVSDGNGGVAERISDNSVTIQNSAPVVGSATIDKQKPTTNAILTASATSSDADAGDAVTFSYQWQKNGQDIANAVGNTLDLSVAGNGDDGDVITVVATANDGTTTGSRTSLPVTIGNVAPSVVSVTPSSPSDNVGETRTFTVSVADENDISDIKEVWFMANTKLDWSDGATLVYIRASNELYLRDNDRFVGPITPGSGTLSNGAVTIDGASVVVTPQVDGKTLTLTFALQTKDLMRGANILYGRVEDSSSATDAASLAGQFGFVQQGTWIVNGATGAAQAPSASVTPGVQGTSTNLTVGTEFNLTLELTDPNGRGDLESGYVIVNDPTNVSWTNGLTLLYVARTNRLYLRKSDGSDFMGGLAVGPGAGILENEAASINLGASTVTPIENGVRLVLAVTPKAALGGTKQVWVRVQDNDGAVSAASDDEFGFEREGTFVITNPQEAKPQASISVAGTAAGQGTTTPVTSGVETTFTLNLSDADGAGQIESGYILINEPGTPSWTNGFTVIYVARTNRLYLRTTDGTDFIDGGIVGASIGSLENEAGSINLNGCSATRTAQGITLSLPVTFKSGYVGTKQMWSRVMDSAGNVQANNDALFGFNSEGTLQITAPSGIQTETPTGYSGYGS